MLELWHGPTWAFKDVALQFLGNLFAYFLKRRNEGKSEDDETREGLTVVGATSGDTGSYVPSPFIASCGVLNGVPPRPYARAGDEKWGCQSSGRVK